MDASGSLIAPSAGGKHLDGTVQATGGHPAGWMDTASAGFHAVSANQGLAGCAKLPRGEPRRRRGLRDHRVRHLPRLHVADELRHVPRRRGQPDGRAAHRIWGTRRSRCAWAPHEAPRGHDHRGGLLLGVPPVPADALSPGHVDGSAVKMAFGPRAGAGGAAPSFDAATGRCSATYCHGNYSGTYVYTVWDWGTEELVTMYASYTGSRAAPSWSDGTATAALPREPAGGGRLVAQRLARQPRAAEAMSGLPSGRDQRGRRRHRHHGPLAPHRRSRGRDRGLQHHLLGLPLRCGRALERIAAYRVVRQAGGARCFPHLPPGIPGLEVGRLVAVASMPGARSDRARRGCP